MGRKTTNPLQAFREQHQPALSQMDAAKLFGVSQSAWSRWERQLDRPAPKMARRLMRETGATAEWLMGVA